MSSPGELGGKAGGVHPPPGPCALLITLPGLLLPCHSIGVCNYRLWKTGRMMLDRQILGRCHMVHPSLKCGAWLVWYVCIQVRACSPYAIRRCVSCNPNVVPVLAVAVSLRAVPPGVRPPVGSTVHMRHLVGARAPMLDGSMAYLGVCVHTTLHTYRRTHTCTGQFHMCLGRSLFL